MRVPPDPVKDFPSNDRELSERTERRVNNIEDSVPFSGALSSVLFVPGCRQSSFRMSNTWVKLCMVKSGTR